MARVLTDAPSGTRLAPARAPKPSIGGRASGPAPSSRRGRRRGANEASGWQALLWLSPALLLIAAIVIYPAITLFSTSFSEYSITGIRKGDAGFANYAGFLSSPDLPKVVLNTGIWVVAVVAITILIGLALAQFLSKDFWGRRVVRWAVIVPWAAALVITSQLFRLLFDYYHGTINAVLLALHVIPKPIDFLGNPPLLMASMILVGVYVSLPFTAYLFVAGLSAIPTDVYEAARIDGASPWQIYTTITLPLLRPAMLIAVVLNMIYVFNSFPIIWIMNGSNPGFGNDTLITYMYKIAFKSAQHDVGVAAAAGVFNVIVILIAVIVYVRLTRTRAENPS
ncbi:sugar ABC transporter permease [Glaciibacter flavus]|uniref:Sugar ABC transporter permease n=1 Tax=Orlajensenia flava TaxID=2565934 RepID=A0A4S4FVD3_9MICO|nr:sugar ABC transporter permease [Glaciibacter flavus]THG34464.1 sugar ABC transporter permease [Glaciibacter flavus]